VQALGKASRSASRREVVDRLFDLLFDYDLTTELMSRTEEWTTRVTGERVRDGVTYVPPPVDHSFPYTDAAIALVRSGWVAGTDYILSRLIEKWRTADADMRGAIAFVFDMLCVEGASAHVGARLTDAFRARDWTFQAALRRAFGSISAATEEGAIRRLLGLSVAKGKENILRRCLRRWISKREVKSAEARLGEKAGFCERLGRVLWARDCLGQSKISDNDLASLIEVASVSKESFRSAPIVPCDRHLKALTGQGFRFFAVQRHFAFRDGVQWCLRDGASGKQDAHHRYMVLAYPAGKLWWGAMDVMHVNDLGG